MISVQLCNQIDYDASFYGNKRTVVQTVVVAAEVAAIRPAAFLKMRPGAGR